MNIVLVGKTSTGKKTIASIVSENFRYDWSSSLKQLRDKDSNIAIMDMQTFLVAKEKKIPMVSFLIKTADEYRFIRQIENGVDIVDIAVQSKIDNAIYNNTDEMFDFIISNNSSNPWKAVDDILFKISKK